jgi:hypothetical protein
MVGGEFCDRLLQEVDIALQATVRRSMVFSTVQISMPRRACIAGISMRDVET